MKNYLNNLINEKSNISLETIIEVEGKEWGTNFIPLQCVVDYICQADNQTQKTIKNNLVKIDFYNGDIMHFFTYIAEFLAK
jgi:hypothetical protein